MPASIYLGKQILDHLLRGISMPMPGKIWVSLHTGDAATSGTEVLPSQWPAYTRIDANAGSAGVQEAFKPVLSKTTKNAKQLLWPPYNGTGTITIKGIALWTQENGGNLLFYGALSSEKTLFPSDEIVIHVDGLTIGAI